MTIRLVGVVVIALVALSACKAVTLQEAVVTQPTFGIEAEDWGVPATATDELRQNAFHAATPTTHPTATMINTQDLHAQLIGANPPVTINSASGQNRATSIPGSIWLSAAGQAVRSTTTSRRTWHRRSGPSRTTISHDRSWFTASTLTAGCPTTPPCASMHSATRISTGIAVVSPRGRQQVSHANDHGVQAIVGLGRRNCTPSTVRSASSPSRATRGSRLARRRSPRPKACPMICDATGRASVHASGIYGVCRLA